MQGALQQRLGVGLPGTVQRARETLQAGCCSRAAQSLESDVGGEIWCEVEHAVSHVLRHLHDLQVALVQQVVDVEAGARQPTALGFNTDCGVVADVAEGLGRDA
jgi:hypothetical protein